MVADLSVRENELLTDRVPFVHATVVRAQVPTSVHAGDGAIILPDGSIEGFIGGQCAADAVRSAALGAMRDGRSILLRVLPDGETAFPDTPGAQVVVNPCLSGGAIEIFLQPRLPDPQVHVYGQSPIVGALAELGHPLGFVVERAEYGSRPEGATAVVVASHGGDEPAAIRAALDAGVGYVGLVASVRRGASVLDGMGLTAEERAKVHSPVGLDIGASSAPEIALSILAELVTAIRVEGLTTQPVAPAQPTIAAQVVDPVCGMNVLVDRDTPHLVVDGQEHWFCCAHCRDQYAAETER